MSKESRNRKVSKAFWLIALALVAASLIIVIWIKISGVNPTTIVFYHSGSFLISLWDMENLLFFLGFFMLCISVAFSGGKPILRQ
jgi:hypothetical protein